jgi:putative phosphoesterase
MATRSNAYRVAAPSRANHTRRTLSFEGPSCTIVVVADTHSLPHPDAAKHIAAQKPDHIVHGGDIGDLSVLGDLAKIAPVTAVRGNIDAHARDLPDSITLDVVGPSGPVIKMFLTHIAVYGPKIRADVARLATAEGARLVLCGHSHVPFMGKDRGLVVFNPGSIGPRRFHLPILFGVVDIGEGGVKMRHVSVETGERWEP